MPRIPLPPVDCNPTRPCQNEGQCGPGPRPIAGRCDNPQQANHRLLLTFFWRRQPAGDYLSLREKVTELPCCEWDGARNCWSLSTQTIPDFWIESPPPSPPHHRPWESRHSTTNSSNSNDGFPICSAGQRHAVPRRAENFRRRCPRPKRCGCPVPPAHATCSRCSSRQRSELDKTSLTQLNPQFWLPRPSQMSSRAPSAPAASTR